MGAPTEAKVITPLGQVIKAQQTAKCEIVVRLNLQVQNLSLGFYLHIDKRRPGGREVSGGKGLGGREAASFIFQHLERFKQQKKKEEPWRRCRKADKRSAGVHSDKHRKHTLSLPWGLLPQRPHSTFNVIIFHSLVKYGTFGCTAPVRPY